jgi:hypothetical protein
VTTGDLGQTSLGGYETFLAGVNILLDGADATRIDSQATSTQLGRQASRISRSSVDSIEEFKVMSSTYSAEYGRSYGDIVNVITKSGGNDLHGELFEFFRNDAFDALNYFATQNTPLRLNQFGGNLSGPIIKDKLFFFVNYEGVRQIVHAPTGIGPFVVLTAAARAAAVPDMVPVVNALPLPNVPGPVTFPGGTVRTDLGYYNGSTPVRRSRLLGTINRVITSTTNLAFLVTSCTPGFNQPPAPYYYISYPLPNPLPVCTPPLPPNVNALDPNIRDSYSMHWSFGVQQEIIKNTVLEVSYVGNRGVKLPAGAAYAGEELNYSPFSGAPNQISNDFGNIRRLGDFVQSNYHSLQASLRRRISQGLTLNANYTWSHELDDGVNILTASYQNSHNPVGDYANGDIDVRNNFTLSALYDVPTAEFLPRTSAILSTPACKRFFRKCPLQEEL